MGRRFWISDLHLGHAKIAKMRGCDDVAVHDQAIMKRLEQLADEDHVWVLGDISSGRPEDERAALGLLRTVGASLHLIAGNHDSVSSIHRNGYKKQREWLGVFDSIQQFGRIKFDSHQILMSHYPYGRSGDGPGRGLGRYAEYRLPDARHPLIHGHTHHTERHMLRSVEDGRGGQCEELDITQLNVSWDAWGRLVTQRDISDWLKQLH